MQYGHLMTLSERGIHLDPKILQPLGIYNGSRCWGIFLPARSDSQAPHFVISPVPFSSWACAIRLELRISDRFKAVSKALEVIKNSGINLLSLEYTKHGYRHFLLTALGEVLELRQRIEDIKKKPTYVTQTDYVSSYAAEVFRYVTKLKTLLHGQDFIYEKLRDRKGFLFNIEHIKHHLNADEQDYEAIVKTAQEHELSVVQCNWITPLASYWLSQIPRERIVFEYDANKRLLFNCEQHSESDLSLKDIIIKFNAAFPCLLIGAFDPLNKLIRIRTSTTKQSVKELLGFQFDYECNPKTDLVFDKGSIGINYQILSHLEDHFDFRLTNVSTFLSRTSRHHERGSIAMIGVVKERRPSDQTPEEYHKEMEHVLTKSLSYAYRDHPLRLTKVTAKNISPFRLFISTHQEFCDQYEEDIRSIAERYGFLPTISNTATRSVTQNVLYDLRASDALIQIITLRREEKTSYNVGRDTFTPNLGWLLFELGVAKQLGITVISVLDVDRIDKRRWKEILCADQDRYLVEFSSGERRSFEKAFEKAVKGLRYEL